MCRFALGAIVIFVLNHVEVRVYCETMDQIIANAATSVREFDFLQDSGDGTGGGRVTVELDMVFSTKDWEEIQKKNSSEYCRHRNKRKATHSMDKRWPKATLVYEIINRDFSSEDKKSIQNAMDRWSRHTCIRFRRATQRDKNKIRIEDGSMCSSMIGMVQGLQRLTLANGCRREGTIIHELGHALGFYHEHSRPDRDDYIYINKPNIHDAIFYNFDKYSSSVINTYRVRYDYLSIMHYGPKYFAKDYNSYSIITKDDDYQDKIGNREGLSFGDIKLANLMYDCAGMYQCRTKSCPGDGFVGKDCKCWCRGDPVRLCDSRTDGRRVTPAPTTRSRLRTTKRTEQTVRPHSRTTPRTKTRKTGYRTTCFDKFASCKDWSARGDCKHTRLMWEFCPKSCKKCDTGVVVQVPKCEDDFSLCKKYASIGYCGKPAYRGYMERRCRNSCNTCGQASPVTDRDHEICHDFYGENVARGLHHSFILTLTLYFISIRALP